MTDLAQQEQELIALLQEHTSLGNGKARQLLGWDEASYEQVKRPWWPVARWPEACSP